MPVKVGRNEKCPCGSGKKYKHCCLGKETGPSVPVVPACMTFEDDLDVLSNGIVDLIQGGRLEEAERACRRLGTEYPDEIDVLERTAQLREAQGRMAEAREWYLKAAHHAETHEGFDQEGVLWYLDQARRLDGA